MAYNVFISHSVSDLSIIQRLKDSLEINGITAYVAELTPQPGVVLPSKIAEAINQCNCVLAVMTRDGNRSAWVNQEIGYAQKAEKFIVPVVESGVEVKGFISNLEYISFSRFDPELSLINVTNYLGKLRAEKEQQDNLAGGILLVLGIFALAKLSQNRQRQTPPNIM